MAERFKLLVGDGAVVRIASVTLVGTIRILAKVTRSDMQQVQSCSMTVQVLYRVRPSSRTFNHLHR